MKKIILFLSLFFGYLSLNAQESNSFMFNINDQNLPIEKSEDYLKQWFKNTDLSTFMKIKESTDDLNTTHTSYQQLYNNISIEGCVVFVHSKNGFIYCVNGQIADNKQLPQSTRVLISTESAKKSAQMKTKVNIKSDKHIENVIIKTQKNGEIAYRLAIKIRVESNFPLKSSDVYIDAETSEVLNEISLISNIDVDGTAQTIYKGKQNITCDFTNNIYSLNDNQRDIWTYNATNFKFDTEPPLFSNATTNWYIPVLTTVTISSIENSWWSSITDSKPDLYIVIKDENGNQIYKSGYYDDTHPPLTFNLPSPIEIKNNNYKIEIWDYDLTDADDYGGSITISNINKGKHTWSESNHAGSFTISDFPHPALDVHWGMERTFDFFLTKFARNSYDGNGSQIIQLVNLSPNIFDSERSTTGLPNNAFAVSGDNPLMVYGLGDGFNMKPVVSLDIMAHEFTHLVTSRNGNGGLTYQGESGALNESFSDIFACGVEFFVGINPNWTIGEDVMINVPYMRSMSNPKSNALPNDMRQPSTYLKEFWINTSDITNDHGGVHINCGVQNHWFYLLSQGGSGINDLGRSYSVSGIGIDNALKIAYRSLTTYLTPQASFKDACNGSLQATKDIFGENSSHYTAVKDAWDAVGVLLSNTSPNVIITQVYGGGGNSGAIYKSDFVELYNTTNSDINISGWNLYYLGATSASTNMKYVFPTNTIIKANKYYVLKCADGAGTQPAWNITFDGTSTLALGGSAGKLILLKTNDTFTLSAAPSINEIINNPNFADYVTYGTTPVPIWGSAMTANTTNSTAAKRKLIDGNHQYTKNIGNDFEIVTAEPRNSSITTKVEIVQNSNISLYAANKTIYISGSTNNEIIEIYSTTGLKVYSSMIFSNSVRLVNLTSGIYIVRIGLNTYKIIL